MKLLATDMDGTFLRDDKSYNDEFNDLYKQMLKTRNSICNCFRQSI